MTITRLFIPDLPAADALLPWLRRMDASRQYTNFGPLVQELEHTLAQHWPAAVVASDHDVPPLHVVTLNTGTAPLELGMAALGLAKGADVLLPSFSFPATAAAVLRCGLQPVFADVDPDVWQLTPALARNAARQRRLALVMPVATFGCPLDVAAWDAFVDETGIPVLIDAAAAFDNQAVGRRAAVSFSLHATKPFGIGEGGLLVTRDAALAARVRRLSNFGLQNGQALVPGTNAKLSEYAAAVALAQWARWPALQAGRAGQWRRYLYWAGLSDLPGLVLQGGFASSALPSPLVLRLPCAADGVAAALAAQGIETRRWYCPALHTHAAFAHCAVVGPEGAAVLPVTEHLATHTLGVPWHNFLKDDDMALVVHALKVALNAALKTTLKTTLKARP